MTDSTQTTDSDPTFNRTSVELKQKEFARLSTFIMAFNRTSVELKHDLKKEIDVSKDAFNRTSVELKHSSKSGMSPIIPSFNRTSVELKLVCRFKRYFFRLQLLIEPVWN